MARIDPSLPPVLLIGIDSPIGLTVMRELGQRGVRVAGVGRSSMALGVSSRYCHSAHVRPAGPMVDWLGDLVAETGIGAVMAVSESDLTELAALHDTFDAAILAVPSAWQLTLVQDKSRTLAMADEQHIRIPQSWQPRKGEDFATKAEALPYPVAIKWADPARVEAKLEAAGIPLEKIEYADTSDALLAILARTEAIGEWPLVQEYCPGVGLGQMFNMESGKATLRFQHRRLREWPPTGGVSSYCRSEPLHRHQSLLRRSEAFLASLDWRGPAMVEYRHDPSNGQYWLMEVNGRFWGSLPLAHRARAQFGWEAYRTMVLGEQSFSPAKLRNARARYMVPELRHLAAVMRDRDHPLGSRAWLLLRFLGRFLDLRMGYYVWSWRDPAPFFADMKAIVTKALRRDKAAPTPRQPAKSG